MWVYKDGELYHYGVKGQKWGVRRYQKTNGTLTAAGKKRREAYSAAKDAYHENDKISRAYFSYINDKRFKRMSGRKQGMDPTYQKLKELIRESDVKLENATRKYLSTLSEKERKSIIKFDDEHQRRYVDPKIFDKNSNWDQIYIDDED